MSRLVLTRKENQSILIDGDIILTVIKTQSGNVKLSFDAPEEVEIVRTELLDQPLNEPSKIIDR